MLKRIKYATFIQRPLVLVVGLALTAICMALFIAKNDLIDAISNRVYDSVFRLVHECPKSKRIVIVDVDDLSLERVGQWPWPRYILADLTKKMLAANPSVIAFDIAFVDPDRTSPSVLQRDMKDRLGLTVTFPGVPAELMDYDEFFGKALQKGRIILGCAMRPVEELIDTIPPSADPYYDGGHIFPKGPASVNVNRFLLQATNITTAVPPLRRMATSAFFNTTLDEDNIVRKSPLVWALGPSRIYPSLALEAVRQDAGADKCVVEYNQQGVVRVRIKDISIPCEQNGRMVVRYRDVKESPTTGLMTSFPTVSAADILDGNVADTLLSNKIVFVGASAMGLRDIRATPMTELYSGVEIHATIADNILARDMLSLPNYMAGVQCVAIFLTGLFLTALIYGGRSWFSFVGSLGLAALTVQASVIAMRDYQVVFSPTWVILTVLIIYPVLMMLRFWKEERGRRRVRFMFGTMVSKDVLHYIEANPQSFSLSGERAEATILFSDLAGFATISDGLEPQRLSDLMNRYLTPMTDVIMARKGFVDKYVGDAIMAVWGVPFRMEDHAAQACLAAIEQQERLTELQPQLKAEFGCDLFARIGINSGVVTAGNMGSSSRFSYTVMGDAVNIASRLEPANKDYGSRIIIGGDTYEAAKAVVEARLLDRLVVIGRSTPVNIYELLGKRNCLTDAKRRQMALYEEALHLDWERKWDKALDCLKEALTVAPDDKASSFLRKRVQDHKANPPPENWRGEIFRTIKG